MSEFGKKVLAVVKGAPYTEEAFFFGEGLYDESKTAFASALPGVSTESVARYGGEGQGEECWEVWRFTSPEGAECHIKFSGWYASYDGAEFTEAFEVEPREVVVTQYFKV